MDANMISAKMLKAEMMGDMNRVAELKQQLNQLNKTQAFSQKQTRRDNNYHSNNNESRNHQKSRNPNRGNADELNKLNAKIIKAEMMGDSERVKELKAQLEGLQNPNNQRSSSSEESQSFVRVSQESKTNAHSQEQDELLASRLSGCTPDPQKNAKLKQLSKKISDDRFSLKEMFVSAKRGEVEDEAKLFIKSSSKLINADDEYEEVVRKGNKKRREDKEERPKVFTEPDDQECGHCIQKIKKHLVVSIESTIYLCLPHHEPFVDGHCYIRSRNHIRCTVETEENCLTEILGLRKKLCEIFKSQKKGMVFTEMFFKKGRNKHFQIECFPIKQKYMADIKMYFKKAIMECEKEWSMNKKLVEMKDKCITKSLPKGLSYFWVSFGPSNDSYGHVIEDEQDFSRNFAYEVIAGLLDIDRFKYTKPRNESFDEQFQRVSKFKQIWKQIEETVDTPLLTDD